MAPPSSLSGPHTHGPLPPGPDAEHDARRAKRALLDDVAAFGYDQTTVPDVCRRAGISLESFLACFADKTSCFEAALADVRIILLEVVLSAAPAPTPLAVVGQAIDAFGAAAQADPAGLRCLLEEIPPRLQPALRQRELFVDAALTHLQSILGTRDRLGCRMLLAGIVAIGCPWHPQAVEGTTEDLIGAAAALWPRAMLV